MASCPKPLIAHETFTVLLADGLIDKSIANAALSQIINQYYYQKCGVVAAQEVPRKDTSSYGIIMKTPTDQSIKAIVEKPIPEKVPSNKPIVGRYIFPGKMKLTDIIVKLIKTQRLVAHNFEGQRYHCGDVPIGGLLIDNFELEAHDKLLGRKFTAHVQAILYCNVVNALLDH